MKGFCVMKVRREQGSNPNGAEGTERWIEEEDLREQAWNGDVKKI